MSTIFLDDLNEEGNDADNSAMSSDDGRTTTNADASRASADGGPSSDGASSATSGRQYSFDPHLEAFAGQGAGFSEGAPQDSDDTTTTTARADPGRPARGDAETSGGGGGSGGVDSGSDGEGSQEDAPKDRNGMGKSTGNAGQTVAQAGTAGQATAQSETGAARNAPSPAQKASPVSDQARATAQGKLAATFQKNMTPEFWDRFETALAMDRVQGGHVFTAPLLAQIAAAKSPPKVSILLYNSKAPGLGNQSQANGKSFAKVASNWTGGPNPIDISDPDWKNRYESTLAQNEGARFDVMLLDHGAPGKFAFGNLPSGRSNFITGSNVVNNPILNQLLNGRGQGKIDDLWLLTCNTRASDTYRGPETVNAPPSALPQMISDAYGVNVHSSKGEWRMDGPADPRDTHAYPAPGFSVRLPWTEDRTAGGLDQTGNKNPQPWR